MLSTSNFTIGMEKHLMNSLALTFNALKLGRAHQMRFGAYSLYSKYKKKSEAETKFAKLLK